MLSRPAAVLASPVLVIVVILLAGAMGALTVRTSAAAQPRDAAGVSTLFLRGPVTAVWNDATARITVGEVGNQETSPGQGSNLGLQLVATASVPTVGQDGLLETASFPVPGFYILASAGLPPVG